MRQMKTFITKRKGGKYTIIQETTLQSIASDMASLAVIIGIMTMAIIFSKVIGKSFLIDLFAILAIVLWFIMKVSKVKSKTITKEELINELEEELK